jgi:hypothetical protein
LTCFSFLETVGGNMSIFTKDRLKVLTWLEIFMQDLHTRPSQIIDGYCKPTS